MQSTFADTERLTKETGYKPSTPIQKGIIEFLKWYNNYYHVEQNKQQIRNNQ